MKKILIIQQDDGYFLFEALQTIEKNRQQLKDFDVTILVKESALKSVFDTINSLTNGITTDQELIKHQHFDISVNLSLSEESWDFHGLVSSQKKLGPYKIDGILKIDDLWSSYLLTLKSKTPFVTFHLQDIYKNIFGFKQINHHDSEKYPVKQIVLSPMNIHMFSAKEQEGFIYDLSISYPHIQLKDMSEVDLISDLTHSLYIGPASLESLKFCEAGGKGIFLTSIFQGFNLIPNFGQHKVLSSKGMMFESFHLMNFIENEISGKAQLNCPYSIYTIDHKTVFGSYLKSQNDSDQNYPAYQSHVVLWNFLLNLHDVNLEITVCDEKQIQLLQKNHEILLKLIRLHDYALFSIDTIYRECKASQNNNEKIQVHIDKLIEIEKTFDAIAVSSPMLRQIIDFYKIRRGQNNGSTLAEQSQSSFLAYSEEHQALQALIELFSVTLRRNEASI